MIRIINTLTCFMLFSCIVHAEHILWYEQPAADWNEALPLGNGRMGAMVFGDPGIERIQVNEDSMCAGQLKDFKLSIGTPSDLATLRKLVDEGKHQEADREFVKRFSRGSVRCSHQTFGDLYFDWKSKENPVLDYRRQLNLDLGVATIQWTRGDTRYTQEVFCSNPDEAVFVKLAAEGPETLNLDVRLERPMDQGVKTHRTTASRSDGFAKLVMSGQVTQQQAVLDGKPVQGIKGVRFLARADVVTQGGKLETDQEQLQIRGARVVFLQLTARTDYDGQNLDLGNDGSRSLRVRFDALRRRHVEDHGTLYDRCRLDLRASPDLADRPTDERFARLREGGSDAGLDALMFHYGRYLLIASSRSNGHPANLQGLWNRHIKAPWNSGYFLNINLPMNYWLAEVTNLGETHIPLFEWMKRLAENGAVTAKQQYGMQGWMSHHCTELFAQPVMDSPKAKWGGWIHGGGWMCQNVWSHYDYTRDMDFLRETGYPLLSGQARFYLDWLVDKDGVLISYPETSPENRFRTTNGEFAATCAKAAIGQQIITEVFTNTLSAAKLLGIEDDLTAEIQVALTKLDHGQHIGADGRLLEWDRMRHEEEPGHRHLSHLYGFHPGISITEEKTPELVAAVRKSIETRELNGSADVGWSRAWSINIHARLRDGNRARFHIQEMLRTQLLNNGFNSVFGIEQPLFQIEANLGTTAGIAEMLMQSHGGFVHLLPALPEAWPDGSVVGLRARGGHTIDVSWKHGKLDRATITKGPGTLPEIQVENRRVSGDPRITIR